MGAMKLLHSRGERDRPIGGPAGMYRVGDTGWIWAGIGPRPEFRWEHSHLSPYVTPDPPPVNRIIPTTNPIQQTLF
jgi:hypothetical protein